MEAIVLHSGGRRVTMDELAGVETPAATSTHVPIPHIEALTFLRNELTTRGWRITDTDMATSNKDQRFFGLLQVRNEACARDDWSLLFGLRNAHDKKFKLSYAVGERVFICDNLAFHGEYTEERKHTSRLMEDVPGIVVRAVNSLLNIGPVIEARNDHYLASTISTHLARHAIIELCHKEIISARDIMEVDARYWEDNQAPTMWRLKNAVTEVSKRRPTSMMVSRTQKMHTVLDELSGFDASKFLGTLAN